MKGNIYRIQGMHCASCAVIIDKKIKKLDGVNEVQVNFATEKAIIDFNPETVSVSRMNDEIGKLGYTLVEEESRKGVGTNHIAPMNAPNETTKEQELEISKSKTEFVMPIALFVFVIMLWDIAARTFPFERIFPIPRG